MTGKWSKNGLPQPVQQKQQQPAGGPVPALPSEGQSWEEEAGGEEGAAGQHLVEAPCSKQGQGEQVAHVRAQTDLQVGPEVAGQPPVSTKWICLHFLFFWFVHG